MSERIAAVYRERARTHEAAAAGLARRSERLGQGRILAFAGFVAAGVAAETWGTGGLWAASWVLLALFVALVVWHGRLRKEQREHEALASLNHEGLARLRRDWSVLPLREAPAGAADHAYAADLDLFGRASLTQLLGPRGSDAGGGVLDEWLLERAPPTVIVQRQEAARELAARVEWRERLALHARRTPADAAGHLEGFVEWAESPPRATGATLTVLPYLVPLLVWGPLIAGAFVPLPPLWLIGVAAALLSMGTTARAAQAELGRAFGRESLFEHYPALFATIAAERFHAPLLAHLQERLHTGGIPAPAQIARLRRIMNFADARFSSSHFLLQLGFLWDLHVLRALYDWKRGCGAHVRDWLRAAAETEALACLGTLAHDQPEWTFPVVDPGLTILDAELLGHPLIPDERRVANDVRVGPPGTLLLVTGSNMSGKSTLLRAIGLNAVLAQAGAPCCARALRMPPLAIASSIRVQDSLSQGVSYFMAELQRLKQVVDAAEDARGSLLFLLDEILHGTNTAERRIAARRVIAHLVGTGAIGAVTTHDLELAGEELSRSAIAVHFTEHFELDESGAEVMAFDYVLREGIAPSTNALKLMELVGLGAGRERTGVNGRALTDGGVETGANERETDEPHGRT